jgi:arylsulfatase A-like enzyme
MDAPNVLLIMTDEERYPPPYERDVLAGFRRNQLGARQSLRDEGLEFHRHYVGSTACLPSRTTLFTGQYPSLHGGRQTDGMAKRSSDPAMTRLDPNSVPTLGDWFRAGGYQTHYRGKWHISHADLLIPGTHEGLMASDDAGESIAEAVAAYRGADRLNPFGFSGWIGREPHGAAKADCGTVRDGVFAEQVVELFGDLATDRTGGPWLAVASFVNPHDIAFNGWAWENILGFAAVDESSLPEIPEAPSQSDSFAGRPSCQEAFASAWPRMLYDQQADAAYRRLYHHLHQLVDGAIARILEALDSSGMADDTIVVFTSDHGDLVGAHGGLMQKWYNAYDEALRVPLVVKGPGVAASPTGIDMPTSHVDLVPTLMGLAGIDADGAAEVVAREHDETHPLVGRDLSGLITGSAPAESFVGPLYFMTEDDVTRGLTMTNMFTGKPYEAVAEPSKVESIIATLPTGPAGTSELWKLNHYYDRLDEFDQTHDLPPNPFAGPAAAPEWELHNLTLDPEERDNRHGKSPDALAELKGILETEREAKRLLPRLRNPRS